MDKGDSLLEHRKIIWTDALILPGEVDLQSSLIFELARYLGKPVEQVKMRCSTAAADLAQVWRNCRPSTHEEIDHFYQQADTYIYDLTWRHTLAIDDDALIQVEALETALSYHASNVLDFGSGIGSLGLLLARNGLNVTLADVNPFLINYASWRFDRRGMNAQFIDLRLNPLPLAAFDFISAIDVFEHLSDPRTTLVRLASSLRPGGVLFIHFPNCSDETYPMHIWRDYKVLLTPSTIEGLSLEYATDSILILRRSNGLLYTHSRKAELLPEGTGGILLWKHPFGVMLFNSRAFEIIAYLDTPRTAAEIATHLPDFPLVDVTVFLNQLVQRHILISLAPPPTHWPSVSIIVPARNRHSQTRRCIESLLNLIYDRAKLEIIVVDDASDPPLSSALDGLSIKLLRNEVATGQSAARNHASFNAQGEILAFIDNDCEAHPNWLRILVPYFDNSNRLIVAGRTISPLPLNHVAAYESVRSPLDMGDVGIETQQGEVGPFIPSCNFLIRKDLFHELDGFNENMHVGEDIDFVWRANYAGVRIRYVPEGTVFHHHRTHLGAFLRRRLDYGSGEAEWQLRHPMGRKIFAIPLAISCFLITLLLLEQDPKNLVGIVLLASAIISIVTEFAYKYWHLHQISANIPWNKVFGAILREHGASAYHLAESTIRYYSFPLLFATFFWPPLASIMAILFFIPVITDYYLLKPDTSFATFSILYWLDIFAYQLGVWKGCLTRRTLRPLIPTIKLRR